MDGQGVVVVLLKCKACGEVISAENIDFQGAVGTCPACDIKFEITQLKGEFNTTESPHSFEFLRKPARLIAEPSNVKVNIDDNQLQITHPRYGKSKNTLAIAAAMWFIASLLFASSGSIITLVFILLTLRALYALISAYIFSIVLHVDRNKLRQHQQPFQMPWSKQIIIPTDNISQLFCTMRRVGLSETYNVEFSLYASQKKGEPVLLWITNDYAPLLYIEQQVEQFLGIKDDIVIGEMWSGVE